jgi:hypothetical protein
LKLSARPTIQIKKLIYIKAQNLTSLVIGANIVDMKWPNITVPRPSELFFAAVYFGGLAVCLGKAFFANLSFDTPTIGCGTFFLTAGEWTIIYAVVCYLFGWWRTNTKTW